jgi:hypothetical protein
MSLVELTHPDNAALVDPLSACGGKRVGESFFFFRYSLFSRSEEKDVDPTLGGDDRVSQYANALMVR